MCIVVLISLCITFFTIWSETAKNIHQQERDIALSTAKMVAEAPITAQSLEDHSYSALRKYTTSVQQITKTEFVVVMDMNGIRKTHPNPQKIGKRFAGGDEKAALQEKNILVRLLEHSADPCVLLFLFMIKMESSLGLWP